MRLFLQPQPDCLTGSLSNRCQGRIDSAVTYLKSNEMKNPWTKKNPLLSMWLSGANAVASSVRGRAIAEGKRQMAKGAKQATTFWSAALVPAPTKRKKRKAR